MGGTESNFTAKCLNFFVAHCSSGVESVFPRYSAAFRSGSCNFKVSILIYMNSKANQQYWIDFFVTGLFCQARISNEVDPNTIRIQIRISIQRKAQVKYNFFSKNADSRYLFDVTELFDIELDLCLGAMHGRHEISALASFVLFLPFGPLSPAFVPL